MTGLKKSLNNFFRLTCLLTSAALFTCEKVPDYCGKGEWYNPDYEFCYANKAYSLCAGEDYHPLTQGCASVGDPVGTRCLGDTFVPVGTPCAGYTLSTAVAPSNGGTITRTIPGPNYDAGSHVSVFAEAADGYRFVGWAGVSESIIPVVPLTMGRDLPHNMSLVAMFSPTTITLETTVFPPNAGTINRSDNGMQATVTAEAAAGFAFSGWSGAETSTQKTITVTVDEGKTLVAMFTPVEYTLTVSSNPETGGAVFVNGTALQGDSRQDAGTVEALAQPVDGYVFTGWSGAGTGTANPVTVNITSNNQTLTANFEQRSGQHTLAVAAGDGGTVTGSGTFTEGTNQTITATPDSGCTFGGWTGAGVANPSSANTTVSMTSNRTVIANFSCDGVADYCYGLTIAMPGSPCCLHDPNFNGCDGVTPGMYTLTLNADPVDCAATLTGGGEHNAGSNAPISVTAAAGCTFTNWTGATGITNASSVNASVLMNAAKTVTANFARDGGNGDGHFNPSINYGSFTDTRDDQVYRTVVIGGKTWMAENLNFETSSGSWCYRDSPDSCARYGRLYDWATVMDFSSSCNSTIATSCVGNSPHRGICPSGWHVPSDAEWTALTNVVGGASTAGTKLKAKSGWTENGNGTDDYGFSALPGGSYGIYIDTDFLGVGWWGYWWSTTQYDAIRARYRRMGWGVASVEDRWDYYKVDGLSLRCVQDDPVTPNTYSLTVTANPEECATNLTGDGSHIAGMSVSISVTAAAGCIFTGWTGTDISNRSSMSTTVLMNTAKTVTANFTQTGTFIDGRDLQEYRWVKIGTQTWMAENLNWAGDDGDLGWCYNNEPDSCTKYGRLYDWATAMDLSASCNENSCASQVIFPHQGICPPDWHVPSDAEWTVLTNAVGGESVAGAKLKAKSGWGGGNGTDDFGFSALPGGHRVPDSFNNVGNSGRWWSAREHNATAVWIREMVWQRNVVEAPWGVKAAGFSLRCVRD